MDDGVLLGVRSKKLRFCLDSEGPPSSLLSIITNVKSPQGLFVGNAGKLDVRAACCARKLLVLAVPAARIDATSQAIRSGLKL